MAEKKLIEKYSDFGIVSGSELYLPIVYAFDFLNECVTNNIGIMGVEFFHVVGDRIVPVDPINSIDASIIFERHKDSPDLLSINLRFVKEVLQIEMDKDKTQYCNFQLHLL